MDDTLLVQLILSVIVMPLTPLCWLYVTRQLVVELRALATAAPAVWAMVFMVLMPGVRADLPALLIRALWPSNGWYYVVRTSLIAMLVTLLVGAGAGYLSLVLGWSRRAVHTELCSEEAGDCDRKLASSADDARAADHLTQQHGWLYMWGIRLLEAVCVELAWRAYLLPRLLLVLSLPVSLTVVATLSASSAVPVAISFIYEHLLETDAARHFSAVVFFYLLIVVLQSFCLAWLVLQVNFCVWPAAVVRLYWPSIVSQVNGIRSLTGLADVIQPGAGIVRGPRWKCSVEGAAGVFVMVPVALTAYQTLLWNYDRSILAGLFPSR